MPGPSRRHSRIRQPSKSIRRFRLMVDGWRTWPPPKAIQTSTSSRFHRLAPSIRLRPAAERRRGRPTASSSSFTRSALNRFVVVDIRAEQGLTLGAPVTLPIDDAIHPLTQRNYDVTPDGKQLLIVLPAQTAQTATGRRAPVQINIVLNWFEELKRLVPTP